MFYLIGEYVESLQFLKSIYLRSFMAFMLAFVIVLIAGKPFINYLKVKKFGEKIREEGPASHMSKKGTPTMGGVLMILTILATSLMITDITNPIIILLLITMICWNRIY